MINDYELKNEENKKVLYVYLDFNYEFGSFTNFGKNLRKELNDIIKTINANKIKIIVNGILISTLLVSPVKLDNDNKNNIIYVKDLNIQESNKIIEKLNNESSNIILEKVKNNDSISTIKILPKEINNSSKSIETNTNINNQTINKEISNENIINDNVLDQNFNNNSINVTINRSNGVILNIELETYLIGVVASEMPASFNIEALKAQAIVARTYTLKKISEGKILTDTSSTQVYKNDEELKNMWGVDFDKYYSKIKTAVNDTKNMYITYNGNYIDAVYHSTSNGYTEDAINVWGNYIPYLKSVLSSWDKNASSYKRTITFTFDEFKSKLGIEVNKLSQINVLKNNSNRVSEISIDNNTFSGIDFRTKLGLRSTDFNLEIDDNIITITTYGYGHGVGMSQYGANGMANNGYNCIDILNHYYSNVKIEK